MTITARSLALHRSPNTRITWIASHRDEVARAASQSCLRADLEDAFVDDAPAIEVAPGPRAVEADLVVLLPGVTVSTDPNASVDRAALGHTNHQIFTVAVKPFFTNFTAGRTTLKAEEVAALTMAVEAIAAANAGVTSPNSTI